MPSTLRHGLETCVYIGEDQRVYKRQRCFRSWYSVSVQLFMAARKMCCVWCVCGGLILEVDVSLLASQLFWHLYLVHECGLVHGDIKPANVLRMSAEPQQYVLCDWDSAARLNVGEDIVISRRRCSAGFCETGLLNCESLEDLLGLYWTVAYMVAV